MRFAWEFFALITAFNILVLSAFPKDATFMAFPSLSQLFAIPVASKAFILFKSKCWTKTTVNSTGSNLSIQLISPILIF